MTLVQFAWPTEMLEKFAWDVAKSVIIPLLATMLANVPFNTVIVSAMMLRAVIFEDEAFFEVIFVDVVFVAERSMVFVSAKVPLVATMSRNVPVKVVKAVISPLDAINDPKFPFNTSK